MDRIIVITGGSGGLGKQLSDLYIDNKDIVCCLSRSNKDGVKNFYVCDVEQEDSVNEAIDKVVKDFGKIDILILNAGIGLAGDIETTPSDMVKKVFDVNFFGALYTVKAALKYMQGKSKIIAVSSASAFFSLPYRSVYSASKSALNMITNALYMELKSFNIQVCTVCPGEIDTPFTKNRLWHSGGEKYKNSLSEINNKFLKHKKSRMSVNTVANKIYQISNKNHLPPVIIIGAKYKVFYILSKILPYKLLLKLTMKMYGGKAS